MSTARDARRTAGARRTSPSRPSPSRTSAAARRPSVGRTRSVGAPLTAGGATPELVLVVAVGLLCGLGVVMVYSASSVAAVESTGSSWTIALRQAMWLAGGTAAAVLASRLRLATWRDRVAGPLLLFAGAGLAWLAAAEMVRRVGGPGLPFAVDVKGATRWLGVGAAQFQPSELAKPALVLWTARLLSDRRRDLRTWEGLRPVVVALVLVCGLVVAGDDLGTTLLLGVVVLAMLLVAGAPLRFLATVGGGLAATAMAAVLLLEGFRLERISAFLDPAAHSDGAALQAAQARIGLASGGLFGSGPGYSRAKWGFLPEAHTDFILAVIGEELGLVGTVVVIGLFLTFVGCGCLIALRCTDPFGRLMAVGVTTWIGVQAFINIGVAVGTLPTKGITLPFVSYGGSSLVVSLLGVGMLCSVARAR